MEWLCKKVILFLIFFLISNNRWIYNLWVNFSIKMNMKNKECFLGKLNNILKKDLIFFLLKPRQIILKVIFCKVDKSFEKNKIPLFSFLWKPNLTSESDDLLIFVLCLIFIFSQLLIFFFLDKTKESFFGTKGLLLIFLQFFVAFLTKIQWYSFLYFQN